MGNTKAGKGMKLEVIADASGLPLSVQKMGARACVQLGLI